MLRAELAPFYRNEPIFRATPAVLPPPRTEPPTSKRVELEVRRSVDNRTDGHPKMQASRCTRHPAGSAPLREPCDRQAAPPRKRPVQEPRFRRKTCGTSTPDVAARSRSCPSNASAVGRLVTGCPVALGSPVAPPPRHVNGPDLVGALRPRPPSPSALLVGHADGGFGLPSPQPAWSAIAGNRPRSPSKGTRTLFQTRTCSGVAARARPLSARQPKQKAIGW